MKSSGPSSANNFPKSYPEVEVHAIQPIHTSASPQLGKDRPARVRPPKRGSGARSGPSWLVFALQPGDSPPSPEVRECDCSGDSSKGDVAAVTAVTAATMSFSLDNTSQQLSNAICRSCSCSVMAYSQRRTDPDQDQKRPDLRYERPGLKFLQQDFSDGSEPGKPHSRARIRNLDRKRLCRGPSRPALARGRAGNLGGHDDPSRSQRRSPEEESKALLKAKLASSA